MSKQEGEVRDVPFMGNDIKKDEPSTTGKRIDRADAPGKADSELSESDLIEEAPSASRN